MNMNININNHEKIVWDKEKTGSPDQIIRNVGKELCATILHELDNLDLEEERISEVERIKDILKEFDIDNGDIKELLKNIFLILSANNILDKFSDLAKTAINKGVLALETSSMRLQVEDTLKPMYVAG